MDFEGVWWIWDLAISEHSTPSLAFSLTLDILDQSGMVWIKIGIIHGLLVWIIGSLMDHHLPMMDLASHTNGLKSWIIGICDRHDHCWYGNRFGRDHVDRGKNHGNRVHFDANVPHMYRRASFLLASSSFSCPVRAWCSVPWLRIPSPINIVDTSKIYGPKYLYIIVNYVKKNVSGGGSSIFGGNGIIPFWKRHNKTLPGLHVVQEWSVLRRGWLERSDGVRRSLPAVMQENGSTVGMFHTCEYLLHYSIYILKWSKMYSMTMFTCV